MSNQTLFNGKPKSEELKDPPFQRWIRDIESQLKSGRIEANGELIRSLADSISIGRGIDDKQYVTEKLVQVFASLPNGSRLRNVGTGVLLKRLWDNLQHPPLSYMGRLYRYRTADGSHNNVLCPHIGKSGSFYARSVVARHIPTSLPDPETLFDTLMARRDIPEPHPCRISSLLFALATIIIHDVFRTNDQDVNIVNVSSYLDLSPLYGPNQETQNSIRTFSDGKLKPDAYAEVRMLIQPPECSALLISFNRFHNYMAEQLACINEGGRFNIPVATAQSNAKAHEEAMSKRDDDLFQTARLVTNGLYVHIVINDYVRTILNLHRTETTWNLNPWLDYEVPLGQENIEKGLGNQVSVEFNLIYRWHSAVSPKNEQWLNETLASLFPDKSLEHLTQIEFRDGMQAWSRDLPPDPGQRTFGGLQRNAKGYFEDADLVQMLTDATEDVAGSFGARRIPIALKAVEILGIQQGREWGVATLNEFRRHFGLLPHETFGDISSDPDVAACLEALYGDVDNVELYPGVVIEDAKRPMTPGSGLCAPFTTTRAILSDAVALTRGDRFYAIDYSPTYLTAFGFREASSETSIAGGGVIYKLLMRAFPGWYRPNSIYALYPFTVPAEMREIQQSLGHESDYDYTAPQLTPAPKIVTTWKAEECSRQLGKIDLLLGADTLSVAGQRKNIGNALYGSETSLRELSRFMETITATLVRQYSHKLRDMYEVDIVRDVSALSWTLFTAQLLHIPVKDNESSTATFDARELYDMLGKIFNTVFVPTEGANSSVLRAGATKAFSDLIAIIKPVCENIKSKSAIEKLFHSLSPKPTNDKPLPYYGKKLLRRLVQSGKSHDEIASWIATLAATVIMPSSQALPLMLDLFLTEPYSSIHWPTIQSLSLSLSSSKPTTTTTTLQQYVQEALRLTTPTPHTLRTSCIETRITDGPTVHHIQKGEAILLALSRASRDPAKFPNPEHVQLDRSQDSYVHVGLGTHTGLGRDMAVSGLAAQLRVFGKLRGLRRAAGHRGRIVRRDAEGVVQFLREGGDAWGAVPTGMKVRFDGFAAS